MQNMKCLSTFNIQVLFIYDSQKSLFKITIKINLGILLKFL